MVQEHRYIDILQLLFEDPTTEVNVASPPLGTAMKKTKKNEENPVAWSDLGDDMLRALMAQLNPFDRIRFRAVCRKNWLLTEENKNHHRIEDKLPWLLTFDWLKKTFNSCTELAFRLYDPIHTNPYIQVEGIQALENDRFITMSKDQCVTSKHGWVLFSLDRKYTTIFVLVSPLTKRIMKLPFLHYGCRLQGQKSYITTPFPETFITFSTPPDSADCVFFVLRDYVMDRKFTISTYRRPTVTAAVDKKCDTWTTKVFDYSLIRERIRAVYADTKGILYFVSDEGRMATYIAADEELGPLLYGQILNLRGRGHLIESNGDFLLVDDINTRVLDSSRSEEPRVFKYNWVKKYWVRMNSLRDQALFIGTHNSFAIKADVGDDQTRNIANKIHYIGGNQYKSQPFVYQLEDDNGSGKLQTGYDTDSGYYSYISNEISRNHNMIWIEPPFHLFNK